MHDLYEQEANNEHPSFLSGWEHDMAEAAETDQNEADQKKHMYSLVLEHLLSGKPLGQSEAKSRFGCQNLSSTIRRLRDKKYVVATIPCRDELGNPDTFYRMHIDDQPKLGDSPSFDHPREVSQSDAGSVFGEYENEEQETVDSKPVRKNAIKADSVTLRIGADGPEIQVLSNDDEDGSNTFYKLTPVQVRYLSLNLKLFEEMQGAAG